MKFSIKQTACIIFVLLSAIVSQAQENKYPEVGKRCPDFTLSDISNYSKKQASLHDFEGKWLVLDFWNRGCQGCLRSFPKMDSISRKFTDKMRFISVGYTGSQYSPRDNKASDDKAIRILYERLRKQLDLHFTVAFDSVLFHQFGIGGCPYIVIVDPTGIVKAITYSVTSDDMESFLSGKTPVLGAAYNIWQTEHGYAFDRMIPFLTNGNGGEDSDFLFRSVLTSWKKDMPFWNTLYFAPYPPKPNDFFQSGVPLLVLYKTAYGDTLSPIPEAGHKNSYGQFWYDLVLETSDTAVFSYDFGKAKNLFTYNLIVPSSKANKEYMQEIMRGDLENYFGYSVTVERRKMPCWNLVATAEAKEKLKTKGAKKDFKGDYIKGFELINQPMIQVIRALWAMDQNGPNFYDETGIAGNIDLKMGKGTYVLSNALEQLRENGLDLVQGEKEMNVIIIRDAKKKNNQSAEKKIFNK